MKPSVCHNLFYNVSRKCVSHDLSIQVYKLTLLGGNGKADKVAKYRAYVISIEYKFELVCLFLTLGWTQKSFFEALNRGTLALLSRPDMGCMNDESRC